MIGLLQINASSASNTFNILINSKQDSIMYSGKIVDENGTSLEGVKIKLKGSKKTVYTNIGGFFHILSPPSGSLEISYPGYWNHQFLLSGIPASNQISIKLKRTINISGEVNTVSNGYTDLLKDITTGSFEVLSREHLWHSSDPNLIKRLDGITNAMNFGHNKNIVNSSNYGSYSLNQYKLSSQLLRLTIRGSNSLATPSLTGVESGLPLVVINGVQTPYNIDNLNPNDVESITILKDAGASFVWGSRGANGVIVIKTKKGNYDKPLSVGFNTNFNLSQKPNAFYQKTMTTSEFIDAQIFKYTSSNITIGDPNLVQPQPFYSPVAEILNQQRMGTLTSMQANAQIDRFRLNDIRSDYKRYLYRDGYTQSYAINIDARDNALDQHFFGGYDKMHDNTMLSEGSRTFLTYNANIKVVKDLEVNASLNYSNRKAINQAENDNINGTLNAPFYLYTRLADEHGTPLNVSYKYRPAFLNLLSSTYGSRILDMNYIPLLNINEGYTKLNSQNVNIKLNANYKIRESLSADVIYNYNLGKDKSIKLNGQNSFYMRDRINFYTDPTTLTLNLPLGGLYSPSQIKTTNQLIRGQLNYKKRWEESNEINVNGGLEYNVLYSIVKNDEYLGYNSDFLTINNVLNYVRPFSNLFSDPITGIASTQLPYLGDRQYDETRRIFSSYANIEYAYLSRYIFSASIRKDYANDFGAKGNHGIPPFYSFGGKWNIAKESFYQFAFIPSLQLRSTFGYGGNSNSRIFGLQSFGVFTNPAPTVQLKPDRISMFNVGIDFGFKNNRVGGSLEYYDKRTTDVFLNNQVDPVSGTVNPMTYNSAKLRGRGVDLLINSLNFQSGLFKWTSNLLFSYNRVKVDKSPNNTGIKTAESAITESNYNTGYDVTQIFAYRWAGLDPSTGSPRGFVNGQTVVVTDNASYYSIANQDITSTRYFGSAVPVYFGSLRNTLHYGSFSVSANIQYKLGYFFRRPLADLVQYNALLNNDLAQGAEYANRWIQSGDEIKTNVPSMLYPANQQRDNFYRYSEINVLKGDHIRLQEINLSYTLDKKEGFLRNARLYANISNLGIIWRENKLGLDPEVYDFPNPRTYAIGLSANF